MSRLIDKVAIVTGDGTATGIGTTIAQRFAAEGARVAVVDGIGAGDGPKVIAEKIGACGAQALPFRIDISDEDAVRQVVTAVVAELGSIDVLCNVATIRDLDVRERDVQVADLDTHIWDLTMAINLRGYFLMCKHAIPTMITSPTSSIINASTAYGSLGSATGTAYGVSKGAVNTLTKYIAKQYGKRGLRCNALSLGPVQTGHMLGRTTPETRAQMLSTMLTPDIPVPASVADVATFLASDESRYITGAVVALDGGITAHYPG
jgi:NAD(P)-dependent dehydrogenase (short-subunit alcohol dehydrogenase family)